MSVFSKKESTRTIQNHRRIAFEQPQSNFNCNKRKCWSNCYTPSPAAAFFCLTSKFWFVSFTVNEEMQWSCVVTSVLFLLSPCNSGLKQRNLEISSILQFITLNISLWVPTEWKRALVQKCLCLAPVVAEQVAALNFLFHSYSFLAI